MQGDGQEGDVRGSLSITASTPVKCPCASSTTGAPLPTDQRGVLFEQPGLAKEMSSTTACGSGEGTTRRQPAPSRATVHPREVVSSCAACWV